MRPILFVMVSAVTAALAIPPAPAIAQDPYHAPILLALPGGTRAQAMGRAGVAMADADAIFHNPAQLVTPRGMHLSAQRYGGAATLGTVSTAMAFLGGGVGIGVQWLDYEIPSPVLDPLGGEASLPAGRGDPASELVASLGYARTYRGFRVGAAAKAIEMRYVGSSATFAADIGIARTFFGGLTVGVAAQNLGPSLEVDTDLVDVEHDLPRRYTVGAAFQGFPVGTWFDLAVSAAVPFYEDGTVVPGGGVELSYIPIEGVVLSGRAGVRAVESGDESPYSFGAAFGFDGLSIEYAYQGFDVPGTAHRVGIRLIPQG